MEFVLTMLAPQEQGIDVDEVLDEEWLRKKGPILARISEIQHRLENLELRLQKDMQLMTQSLEISGPLMTEMKTQIKIEVLADVQKRSIDGEESGGSAVLPEAVAIGVRTTGDVTTDISLEYCLQESIWDLGVFVGCDIMGSYGSWMVALLFLLNIIMQIGFCIVCHYNFTDNPFNEATQNGLRDFRLRIAHDQWFTDTTTLQTLVSQICTEGIEDEFKRNALVYGIAQVDTLASIHTYLLAAEDYGTFEKMFNGQTLCILALACWILTIFKHFNGLWHFCYALLGMPRGRFTDISLDGEDLALKSISRGRSVLIAVVIIVRFGCACLLLYYGGCWLSYTADPKDLVLNAAALEFILDLDQMLFAALAPVASKHFLQRMQPIPERTWRIHKGMDPLSMLGLITLASLTTCFYVFFVTPLVRSMDDTKDILCQGDRNFRFTRDTAIGMMWFEDGILGSNWGTGEDDYQSEAVDKMIHYEAPEIGEQASKYDFDIFSLQDMDAGAVINRINADCSDIPVKGNLMKYLQLFWPALESCRDLQDDCMSQERVVNPQDYFLRIARALCPETCGCASPLSIIPGYGCPTSCMVSALYQTALSNLSCSDTSLSALSVSPSWTVWIEFLTRKINARYGVKSELSEYIAGMKQLGCEFLKNTSKSSRRQTCEGTSPIIELVPLSPICPESCDCSSGIIKKCAPQCTPLYSGVAR